MIQTRCPLSVLAATGETETRARDGELTANVARQWAFTARGASAPRQIEGL